MVDRYYAKKTTIVASPSDSNDGLDPCGFGLSTAAWDDTAKTLTQSGAFSSYTWASGHLIWVKSSTSSTLTAGYYEITSKTDSDTIVLALYTSPREDFSGTWGAGNDTNVVTSSGPFSTIRKLTTTVLLGGDECYIDNGGTWQESGGQFSWGSITGDTYSIPLHVIGTDGAGVPLAFPNRVTITGASMSAGAEIMYTNDGLHMENLRLTAARDNALTTSGSMVSLYNCEIDNAFDIGWYMNNQDQNVAIGCEFHDNGEDGIYQAAGTFLFCSVYDNGQVGIYGISTELNIHCCYIYGNGEQGIRKHNTDHLVISNSVIANNTLDGIYCSGSAGVRLAGVILAGNGGYGVEIASTSTSRPAAAGHGVIFWNNTSGNFGGAGIKAMDFALGVNSYIDAASDPTADSVNDDFSIDASDEAYELMGSVAGTIDPTAANAMVYDSGAFQVRGGGGGGSASGARNPMRGPMG
jgi:hypothetical protein